MPLKIGLGPFSGQVAPGAARTFHEEYNDLLKLAALADEQGYDSVWLSEHHGADDGYMPSSIVILAAMAAVTKRIQLGTAVTLAPFQHPLRFAEDCAVVDQISGGRLTVGLAPGWRRDEFRSFGIPFQQRIQRTVELIQVCRMAWSEPRFSFAGRIYSYDNAAITPKPAHALHVLMGASVEAAAERAGRLADGLMAARHRMERFAELAEAFDRGARAAGRDPAALEIGFLHNVFVTSDGSIPTCVAEGLQRQVVMYTRSEGDNEVEHDPRVLQSKSVLGDPAAVTAELRPWVERYGDRQLHLVVRLHYPGMTFADTAPAVELFARSVMPTLRAMAGA
jgi:alkanesulfonate monooxygenase SsuD/methylene tetrahydromethanopterin reductase-like flavin-dependent oxidoreductase (luciferase family)